MLCVGQLLVSVWLVQCAPFKCSWTFLASALLTGAANACLCTQLLHRWLGIIIQVDLVAQQTLYSLAMSLVPKLELLWAKIVCKCLSTSSLPAAGSVYAACQEPLETRRVEMGGESPSPSGTPSSFQATPASIRRWCLMMGRGKNNSCLGLLSHAVCITNLFNIPRLLTTCICICMMHICKYIYLTLQDKPQQRRCHKGMLAASQVFSMPFEA